MIYLLRHAERVDQSKNAEDKEMWFKSARSKANYYDIPLSSNGVGQAYREIGKILRDYLGEFNYIYCSPFTRCIQTALQFQKYIYDKFKCLVLIRVEYGLSIHLFKEYEMFYCNSNNFTNIKLVNDKFVATKIPELVDKHLELSAIYKRYNVARFDINYKPFITKEQINLEQTFTESIDTRLRALKKISLDSDKSKLTLICAHCETCQLLYNYLNKKWLTPKESHKFGFVKGIKFGSANSNDKMKKLYFLDFVK